MPKRLAAIETTGTLSDEGHLTLDAPIPTGKSERVRVIVFLQQVDIEADAIEEEEWLQAVSQSKAFDFLRDVGEDIYSLEDGKPFEP